MPMHHIGNGMAEEDGWDGVNHAGHRDIKIDEQHVGMMGIHTDPGTLSYGTGKSLLAKRWAADTDTGGVLVHQLNLIAARRLGRQMVCCGSGTHARRKAHEYPGEYAS